MDLPSTINTETGLSEREEYFLDVLFDQANGDIGQAMKLAGYPVDVSVSQVRKKLAKEIKEATKNFIISKTPSAAINLARVLVDPNMPGTKNIIDASKQILDRGDVVQDQNKVNETPRNIIVLLPPKRPVIDLDEDDYEEV